MFCGDVTTVCQHCGKTVYTAPGFCVLCGTAIGEIYRVSTLDHLSGAPLREPPFGGLATLSLRLELTQK